MKRILTLLLAWLLLPAVALAERMYIFPESNTRLLTWDEVAEWDYESLGYGFNEIFARHGYDFEPGREYEYYFQTKPWYRANGTYNNRRDCYRKLSTIEWQNESLIKEVRAYKKQYGDWGKSIWDNFSTGFDTLQGFEYIELRAGQKLAVYSAPSKASWRAAEGKAQVSTNGAIYAAGWESGWLLVMYETNAGSVRVGYVRSGDIRGGVPIDRNLTFAYAPATVTGRCVLTDDPARTSSNILTLQPGATVTWLTRFYNNAAWDYVETSVGGKLVRGFLRTGSLDIQRGADPLESVEYK